MTFDFLLFRKVGTFSVIAQITVISLLYLCTLLLGYTEYTSQGTFFGYPLATSILFVPIYEEILFRGLILEQATKHTTQVKAVFITSILFGLWHLKNIFWLDGALLIKQVLYAICVLSPIFCWITLRTKTIWPGVILHYLNNLLSSRFLWLLMMNITFSYPIGWF